MHRVVIVALDGVIGFDLSTPCEVFERVRLTCGRPAYRVRVCGVTPEVDAGAYQMRLRYGLDELREADTVVLPGVSDIDRPVPDTLLRAVRSAAKRGARIASICTGAFLLAATGLLDGRRATTHWMAAPELGRRFPRVEVDPDVLYVEAGRFLTSAGAAAGLDLCLHLVRRDHGAAVAAAAARLTVVPLEREGGQAQFIEQAPIPTPDNASLHRLLEWLEANVHEELGLEDLARRAAMSIRSLSRHFREQTGTTPLQWLLHARVRRAQVLLETTSHSIESVATHAGFGSVAALRRQFHRVTDTSPQSYRKAFQTRSEARASQR